MLGHKVLQVLGARFDVRATFRGDVDRYIAHGLITRERAVTGVDAMQFETVERAIRDVRPDFVINCVGVVKQLAEGVWQLDGSPAYLKRACEASLRRLGVEAIGLYQFHRPDPATPWEWRKV